MNGYRIYVVMHLVDGLVNTLWHVAICLVDGLVNTIWKVIFGQAYSEVQQMDH